MWVSSNLMFFSSDVSLLTKHNLQIYLFCVLARFLKFIKTVITMQWNKMIVFVKIIELHKSGTILPLLIFHSSKISKISKICGKLMSVRAWGPCTCYDCHWSWILEGFINLSFSMLLFFFFLCIFYVLEWNYAPWGFSLSHFKTIEELNDI